MRDYRKLEVFGLADELAMSVYVLSRSFPAEERYGPSAQVRRAAVSIPANIVEGPARSSPGEFFHFLSIAYGSARELQYELSLASRLGLVEQEKTQPAVVLVDRLCKGLWSLLQTMKR